MSNRITNSIMVLLFAWSLTMRPQILAMEQENQESSNKKRKRDSASKEESYKKVKEDRTKWLNDELVCALISGSPEGQKGRFKRIEEALKEGADSNAIHEVSGNVALSFSGINFSTHVTPLSIVCWNKDQKEVIEILLKYGADPHWQTPDLKLNALHLACIKNNNAVRRVDIVKLLIASFVNPKEISFPEMLLLIKESKFQQTTIFKDKIMVLQLALKRNGLKVPKFVFFEILKQVVREQMIMSTIHDYINQISIEKNALMMAEYLDDKNDISIFLTDLENALGQGLEKVVALLSYDAV